MNKNIGNMTENELKDFVIELQEENSRYERRIKKIEERMNEAIKMIDECACYNKQDKECKCSFSSMAMTKLRNILKD